MNEITVTQNALPSKYADRIARDLEKDLSLRTESTMRLKFNQGQMILGDTVLGTGPFYCYILASCRTNSWYSTKYDPTKKIEAPDCYSIFADDASEANAQPSKNSKSPQCEFCMNCEKNAWGSAADGRKGKACSNVWNLMVVPASYTAKDGKTYFFNADGLRNQPTIRAKLPVTSGKAFAKYIKTTALITNRPSYLYASAVTTALHPKWQFTVDFNLAGQPTDEEILDTLCVLADSAQREITRDDVIDTTPAAIIDQAPVAGNVRY